MSPIIIRAAAVSGMVALLALAQKIPPELGQGWMPEFNHASNQLNALADAIPAEKYSWRPGPGVRSVSEVFMHVAVGNYFLLGQAHARLPQDKIPKITADTEKTVKDKADVIKWLHDSQSAVRLAYLKVDRQAQVKFLGQDATADGVMLRLLVHNHEHMGQMIAYARVNGVVPPWSQ